MARLRFAPEMRKPTVMARSAMLRLAIVCLLFLAFGPSLMAADALHGRLWLKDAANGDAAVGPSMQDGIPQGHALKVAIGGGGKKDAGSAIQVVMREGDREVGRASITLDASGYGEVTLPIAATMALGVYQIHLGVDGTDHETGLGGTFRVIEAAPPLNLPFGASGAALALGAIAFGLLTAWRRQRSA
jgi:hypothetical protein